MDADTQTTTSQEKTRSAETLEEILNSDALVLTVKQAATLLDCSERSVCRACERGMIKAAKVMSMWRINKAALLEYIGIDTAA